MKFYLISFKTSVCFISIIFDNFLKHFQSDLKIIMKLYLTLKNYLKFYFKNLITQIISNYKILNIYNVLNSFRKFRLRILLHYNYFFQHAACDDL